MFDCVLPTRNARNGWLFTRHGDIKIKNAAHKTVMLNEATGDPFVPNGSLGFRFTESGLGKWNLDLAGADPVLTLYGRHDEAVPVDLPRFDAGTTEGGSVIRRGVPARRVAGRLV